MITVIIGRTYSFDIEYTSAYHESNNSFDVESKHIIDLIRKASDSKNIVSVYMFEGQHFVKYTTSKCIKQTIDSETFDNEIKWIQALEQNNFTIRIPSKLYHATTIDRLNSIRKHGLGGKLDNNLWDYTDQKVSGVFLADDEYVAESFVESADFYDDEIEIIVFEIELKNIDLSKIFVDMNLLDNLTGNEPIATWFYNDIISFDKLKQIEL